jgi:hypothetical protein
MLFSGATQPPEGGTPNQKHRKYLFPDEFGIVWGWLYPKLLLIMPGVIESDF